MVACRLDWIAGRATPTTVPSINTMLEPRMVAAKIHAPLVAWTGPAPGVRITASSHGALRVMATLYFRLIPVCSLAQVYGSRRALVQAQLLTQRSHQRQASSCF